MTYPIGLPRVVRIRFTVAFMLVLAYAAHARGQGACCLSTGECIDAATPGECGGLGGVFLDGAACADDPCGVGACCAGEACVEADAYSCIFAGRDFVGAGTSCSSDPCGPGLPGACCQGESCTDLTLTECTNAGGVWLGNNTSCDTEPCVSGACCVGTECSEGQGYECEDLGGVFTPDIDCTSDPCAPPNECPVQSLYNQTRHDPEFFSAGTSEESTGLTRYDNFFEVAGAIEGVSWWGLDLGFDGTFFYECTETDNTFTVSFHEDAAGVPGDAVCSYEVVTTRTPTGIFYLGTELNEYSVTLPSTCVVTNGWVSIVGKGDPDCLFLWMSSPYGDQFAYCDNCGVPEQELDQAFCLHGTEGGVFGACCDDAAAVCEEGIEITACAAADQRFAPDAACGDLEPECGITLGACCRADFAECTVEQEADCVATGGSWLGANALCSQCPCTLTCPALGGAEAEPVCSDGYEDVYNGGCTSEQNLFSPISLCETVCAEGGVFQFDGEAIPDYDWYQLDLDETGDLTWSVQAEYPVSAWIIDASGGCLGYSILASNLSDPCEPLELSAFVEPGTYWLVVAASSFSDKAQCGAGYTATVSLARPCPTDFDVDGDSDLSDWAALAECVFGPDAAPAPDPPITRPECLHAFDLDGDSDVDLGDVGALQSAFTGS